MSRAWFEVNRSGLAKLLARRGRAFVVSELLQNAWDEDGVTTVDVTIEVLAGGRSARVTVRDDAPDGFADLADAYTLFAESRKKSHAGKRGRFCLGEKLLLALASEAKIVSTRGGWRFDAQGRHALRQCTDTGSLIELTLPLSAEERRGCGELVRRLLPPPGIQTRYNGELLSPRPVAYEAEEALPTEIADADGHLRPVTRRTIVELIRVSEGEQAHLYEMGIPVVPTEDGLPFHVNVQQKVPLNMERDNVPPAYMRKIRTLAMNLAFEEVDAESANCTWAREAVADPNASDSAVAAAFRARFGDKAVVFDPTDVEANKRAVAEGYVVVHGSQLSGAEWANVRRTQIVRPAGQVTPTPRPYSADGAPLRLIQNYEWTPEMRALTDFCVQFGAAVLDGARITVRYACDPRWPFRATYGERMLTFNLGKLGRSWPAQGLTEEVVRLLIHELGHHYASDHLSSEYHAALCRIGARAAMAGASNPGLMHWGRYLAAAAACRARA